LGAKKRKAEETQEVKVKKVKTIGNTKDVEAEK